MEEKIITLSLEELKYIRDLVDQSLASLIDVCDDKGRPTVDFISVEEADEEFKLIAGLRKKLEVSK